MARKVYLYDTYFDEKQGISVVGLMTPQGLFSGKAQLNADEDQWNEIIGGTFAELRAWKAYYKYEIRVRKFALKELESLYAQMRKNKSSERVLDKIEFLKLEIDHCKAEIKAIDEEFDLRLKRLDRNN